MLRIIRSSAQRVAHRSIKYQPLRVINKYISSTTTTQHLDVKVLDNDLLLDLKPPEISAAIVAEKRGGIAQIEVGDYIEAFRNGQYSGMVVEEKKSSGGLQLLSVLLRNGKIFDIRSDSVAFSIPKFAFSSLVKNPLDTAQTTISNALFPEFSREIQNYQRTLKLNKALAHSKLTSLHKQLKEKEMVAEDKEITTSLQQLASILFDTNTPSLMEKHITFLHLVTDNIHFKPTRNVRVSDKWILRSENECDKISRIIESIRNRDDAYTGFLSRIKPLITFYENHADPILGTISIASKELSSEFTSQLTASDKQYINFIADWIKSPKVIVDSPYEVFVPTVLKALKHYNQLFVDRSLAIRFLKDVGMFKPWDNISLVEDADVANEFIWSKQAQESDRKMNEYRDAFLSGKTKSIGFNTEDPCAHIRHDFGDLPVYTIDDPSAKEIDDGISIEHVPSENTSWLHVHIADPTAHIPPTHPISLIMQQKVQTLYLPETHFPMLPEDLSSQKFSLGSSAHSPAHLNGAQYAMTFSTKLDDMGNLIDWKVQPSLVKNVIKVYYDDLDTLLAPKSTMPYDPLVDLTKTFSHPLSDIFNPVVSKERKSTLPDDPIHQSNLLGILEVSRRHFESRKRNGAIMFSKPSPVLKLIPDVLDLPQRTFSQSDYATHLPAVQLSLDKSGFSPARQLVAEMMIIGGRIASRFAQENGIDIPFRTQSWNNQASHTELQLREELLKSRDPVTGLVKLQDMVKYLGILPPASVTLKPGQPHVVMGIKDGYTKATSPLRRFQDMIVHWQLKSRLLNEKAPFELDQLKALGSHVQSREKQLSLLQQRSIRFWTINLLDRLKSDGVMKTLEFNCIISMPNRVAFTELGRAMEVSTGIILELGIQGRIEKLDRSLHVGDVVKVRISGLDALLDRVNLELI
ncbi:hypothetical protein BDB01DRAFT_852186 [Pilobolus umbonatus]|nr:hypothetical protein BDB01DRAFT_852186 [Pilobolus umbonatus]